MEDDMVSFESETRISYQQILKDFIFLFQSLPELWDPECPDYTNKVKKLSALEKLREILKRLKPYATIDDVRKKINILRSNYRKELRRIATSIQNGDQPCYVPKSWVFHILQFLNKNGDSISAQKGEYWMQEDERDSVEEVSSEWFQYSIPRTTFNMDEMIVKEEPKEDTGQSRLEPFPVASITPSVPKKRKASFTNSEKSWDRSCAIGSHCDRHSAATSNAGGASTTALYWTEKLDRLEPRQRMLAEKAINDILFEAEMGMLQRHSVQINVTDRFDLPKMSNQQ